MKSKAVLFVAGLVLGACAASSYFVVRDYQVYSRYEKHQKSLSGGAEEPAQFNAEELFTLVLTNPDGTAGPSIRRSSNKVVFINLWATWCVPCAAEFPAIEQLRKQVGDGVDFYLLSDEQPAVIRPVAREYDLPFFTYGKDSLLPSYFRTEPVLPRTFIIKNGRIVFERWGLAPWDSPGAVKLLRDLVNGAG